MSAEGTTTGIGGQTGRTIALVVAGVAAVVGGSAVLCKLARGVLCRRAHTGRSRCCRGGSARKSKCDGDGAYNGACDRAYDRACERACCGADKAGASEVMSANAWDDMEWKDGNAVLICAQALETCNVHALVSDPSAGAITSFVGTTRDNFDGKTVVRLEYESYDSMALKELRKLCESVRERWEVCKIVIIHRTGVVNVGEASVVIGISSTHRPEALEAVHFAINELKARIPIWKKERYNDGSSWKANSDFHPEQIISTHEQSDS